MLSNLFVTVVAFLIGLRSSSFFVIASLLVFVYYYPLVLSDTIFIWDYNSLHQYEVNQPSRFYILFVIFSLLIFGCFAKNKKLRVFSPVSMQYKSLTFDFIFVTIIYLFHLHEVWSAIGFNDKTRIMEVQSYASSISDASLLFIFGLSLINKSKLMLSFVVILGFVESFLGFRYVITHMIVIYLLYVTFYNRRLNAKSLIILSLITLLIIIFKIYNYSIPSLEDVISLTDLDIEDEYVQYLFSNRFNPESTSISVVFNQIISYDFIIPIQHYADIVVSFFPFGSKLFNYDVSSYAQYFKNTIFGEEGQSFASGVFSFYYSTFGFSSLFILTTVHYTVAYALYRATFIGNRFVETRSFLLTLVAILLCYALRSDFVFLFTLIRSLFLTYLIYIFLRYFIFKNSYVFIDSTR